MMERVSPGVYRDSATGRTARPAGGVMPNRMAKAPQRTPLDAAYDQMQYKQPMPREMQGGMPNATQQIGMRRPQAPAPQYAAPKQMRPYGVDYENYNPGDQNQYMKQPNYGPTQDVEGVMREDMAGNRLPPKPLLSIPLRQKDRLGAIGQMGWKVARD